jgi:hypothetical protein
VGDGRRLQPAAKSITATSPIPIAPRAVNRPDDGTAFILGGRRVSCLRVKNPPGFSAVLFSR